MRHRRRASGVTITLCVLLGATLCSFLNAFPITKPRRAGEFRPSLFSQGATPNGGSVSSAPAPPPSIAYLISGSVNDSGRIFRLLHSIYHPKNQYLLHLDRSASQTDRESLAIAVQSVPLFWAVQNVHVVGNADNVLAGGPSALSSTLHGASLLLHVSSTWDWFINLSADFYPLVTQDDLLHILSYLPKDLNFVKHSSYVGWRESRKLKTIIVDPALHRAEKSYTFFATEKRPLPDAFRLFMGSPMGILSRKFIEYCIMGTENFPRTLLMYLSNTASSSSVFFPTVLCNSHRFNRTTVDHSLYYTLFDSKKQPNPLNSTMFDDIVLSGAAFASPFAADDPVLDLIDKELLHRHSGKPVPGGWCLGESGERECDIWGDSEVLMPGPGAKRLERSLIEVVSSQAAQCSDR